MDEKSSEFKKSQFCLFVKYNILIIMKAMSILWYRTFSS